MKPMLLAAMGSAALAAFCAAVPVQAQDRGDSSRNWHRDWHLSARSAPCGMAGSAGRCDHRRSNDGLVGDWYGGEWAYANNQSWESDSYNDWWHDQPWRSYPHWMMHNRDCARQWYAGDTLRC
jgi:hypothetical protein